MMKLPVFLAAVMAAAVTSADAAPAAKPACGLVLDADKVDANVTSGRGGVASGNVVVTQCDMKMKADAVRVTMANGQYDKIIANGKVVLISEKSGVASGDNGVYDVARKLVTMNGHVVLKNGTNVLSGTQLTYNTVTGQAHVDAAPVAPGSSDGRVHAILTPPGDAK